MPAADWYHCSVKMVSRSSGKSAVAAAAYRTGGKLQDFELSAREAVAAAAYRTGMDLSSHETAQSYDFTRRRGITTSFTLAPEHAPDWAYDPQALWNHAQACDTRKNSQTAREIVLALPSELDATDREGIAREFGQWLVDNYGVAVTVAIHAPSRYGDYRNHHAHLLMTTRIMEEDGLGEKTRVLDAFKTGPKQVSLIRETAADVINKYLEGGDFDERVTHLSYEDRGIDKEGTKHLGVAANGKERRGERSDRGDKNRAVEERNADREDLDRIVAELKAIDAEIAKDEERRLDAEWGKPDEASKDTEHPSPLNEVEEEAAAMQAAVQPFINQIRQSGQVQQDGVEASWWERTVRVGLDIYHQARDWAADKWQRFLESRRGDGHSRGPDNER